MEIKDFKNVSVTFTRGNQDAKDRLIELMKITGKTKVDIICDALRQYDPFKYLNQIQQNNSLNTVNNHNNTKMMNFSLDEMQILIEQIVGEVLESKENSTNSSMKNLNNKKIDKRFIDED